MDLYEDTLRRLHAFGLQQRKLLDDVAGVAMDTSARACNTVRLQPKRTPTPKLRRPAAASGPAPTASTPKKKLPPPVWTPPQPAQPAPSHHVPHHHTSASPHAAQSPKVPAQQPPVHHSTATHSTSASPVPSQPVKVPAQQPPVHHSTATHSTSASPVPSQPVKPPAPPVPQQQQQQQQQQSTSSSSAQHASTSSHSSSQANKRPSWAHPQAIHNALLRQKFDPDEIFASLPPTLNIEEIFGTRHKKRARTSSQFWQDDRFTVEEEIEYKRSQGFVS